MTKPLPRIHESDLIVPTLRSLAAVKGGWLSTTDIKVALEDHFNPRGRDAKVINNRRDSFFSQKVRNMICHRHTKGSFISQGYANYVHDGVHGGLRITQKGRAHLRKIDKKVDAVAEPAVKTLDDNVDF